MRAQLLTEPEMLRREAGNVLDYDHFTAERLEHLAATDG